MEPSVPFQIPAPFQEKNVPRFVFHCRVLEQVDELRVFHEVKKRRSFRARARAQLLEPRG